MPAGAFSERLAAQGRPLSNNTSTNPDNNDNNKSSSNNNSSSTNNNNNTTDLMFGQSQAGGSSSSTSSGLSEAFDDSSVGPAFLDLVRKASKKEVMLDISSLSQGALRLLIDLQNAYAALSFQAQLKKLQGQMKSELEFLAALGKLASSVQDPIFQKFGLPSGQRGVMIMKMAVKIIAGQHPEVATLAGDLRELLGLQREETPLDLMGAAKESAKVPAGQQSQAAKDGRAITFTEILSKLRSAPLDVRGPLAEALRLPYKSSPEDIAAAVPQIHTISQQLAAKNMGKPRSELVGEGKLLGPEAASLSDKDLESLLVTTFEHYLNKMLARVVTPVESFTKPPEQYRHAWAEDLLEKHHVLELWGSKGKRPEATSWDAQRNDWRALNLGVTVLDDTVDIQETAAALAELRALEQEEGRVQASKDPCNIGARSVWLHFETAEERASLPPALGRLCDRLAGLPDALLRLAKSACAAAAADADCSEPSLQASRIPKLRIHPHLMAATYSKGAEYHVHKDSYNGTDNQRMLTILLYLNDDWQEGDAGELRLHGTSVSGKGSDEDVYVDLAPLAGRLVIFESREVWHAVREPRTQRWALTFWVMAA